MQFLCGPDTCLHTRFGDTRQVPKASNMYWTDVEQCSHTLESINPLSQAISILAPCINIISTTEELQNTVH